VATGSGAGGLLVSQQPLFQCRSADGREAAESAVGSNDAMARDDQRDGIAGQGVADGPGRSGASGAGRQLGIGLRFPEADPAARQEDLTLERGQIGQVNRRISTEIDVFALEVRDDTLLEFSAQGLLVRDVGGAGPAIFQESLPGRRPIGDGQQCAAHRVVSTNDTKVPPSGLKERISGHVGVHLAFSVPKIMYLTIEIR